MSAIFGILDLEGRPVDPAWIKSMQDDLAHRGPDGQGLYREDSLVLGNMLLQVTPESIYDKSPFEENGLVITANARLDERDALMDRLNIPTEEREKITDPLLLLRSFKKFGKDFVKDIYGDFTFAIWDKERKELFCARDQMGVKPFLYYFQDNRFVFCNELKAIVRLPFVNTEMDHDHLRNQAISIWDEPQRTCWKNIIRLKPAHTLSCKDSNIITNQYWQPKYKRNKQFKTEEESANALRKLLEKVITDHTRVIGGIGVPLSGGLDSSTVACLAAKKLMSEGKKVTTASSVYEPGFSDPDHPDEMEYINEILQQEKNIEPTYVYHTTLVFLNGLDQTFNRQYAPVNGFYYVDDALNKQFHSKSIRRILSGFLGDYTVSNGLIYPFSHLLLSGRFSALNKLLGQTKIQTDQTMAAFIKSGILNQLAPRFIQKAWKKFKGEVDLTRDIGKLPLKLNQKEKLALQQKVLSSFNISNNQKKDISQNIWPENCDMFTEDWDTGSSHYQLELTYPLCDRRVVELLFQIPIEHFYAGGAKRGLIRKSMMGILPDKVRERKTKGYYSPGYQNLLKKEFLYINSATPNGALFNGMDHWIDLPKLKADLQNLSVSKNNDSFDYQHWTLVELIIWSYFNNWVYINIKK